MDFFEILELDGRRATWGGGFLKGYIVRVEDPRNAEKTKVDVECANLVRVDWTIHRIRMPFLTAISRTNENYSKQERASLHRVRSLSPGDKWGSSWRMGRGFWLSKHCERPVCHPTIMGDGDT